jgi:hypothetical protein
LFGFGGLVQQCGLLCLKLLNHFEELGIARRVVRVLRKSRNRRQHEQGRSED